MKEVSYSTICQIRPAIKLLEEMHQGKTSFHGNSGQVPRRSNADGGDKKTASKKGRRSQPSLVAGPGEDPSLGQVGQR